MGWIESKSVWVILPAFADEFASCESTENLESFGEVEGSDEVSEARSQLVLVVVVVALHGGLVDSAVHALHLSVGQGMIELGEAVIDAMQKTDHVKRMTTEPGSWASAVLGKVGEPGAVVAEHGVEAVRNSGDECFQKSHSRSHSEPSRSMP